jgi:hypothetical protein
VKQKEKAIIKENINTFFGEKEASKQKIDQ